MIDTTVDLAEWEESRKQEQAKQQADKAPFFFILKDGQRALVQFLLDYNLLPHTTIPYHKLYDNASKTWLANNVCASVFDAPCALCEQASRENVKKLQARKVTFIPVYVHSIKERKNGEWTNVTYTGEDGEQHPVNGFRMIDTPFASSTILDGLSLAYSDSSDDLKERTILHRDFILARNGAELKTTYTLSPSQRKSLPLPADLPAFSPMKVKSDVEQHRPMKSVETSAEDGMQPPDDDFIPDF